LGTAPEPPPIEHAAEAAVDPRSERDDREHRQREEPGPRRVRTERRQQRQREREPERQDADRQQHREPALDEQIEEVETALEVGADEEKDQRQRLRDDLDGRPDEGVPDRVHPSLQLADGQDGDEQQQHQREQRAHRPPLPVVHRAAPRLLAADDYDAEHRRGNEQEGQPGADDPEGQPVGGAAGRRVEHHPDGAERQGGRDDVGRHDEPGPEPGANPRAAGRLAPGDVHDERRKRVGEQHQRDLERSVGSPAGQRDQDLRDQPAEPQEAHAHQRAVEQIDLPVGPGCPPQPSELAHPHHEQPAERQGAERVREKGREPQRVHGLRIRPLRPAARNPMDGTGTG
jgi:hypothetical protein